jgi:hypothetical protein
MKDPASIVQNSVICINSLRLHYFLSHSGRMYTEYTLCVLKKRKKKNKEKPHFKIKEKRRPLRSSKEYHSDLRR